MLTRIETFDGVYVRAHHGKWHRAVRVLHEAEKPENAHLNHVTLQSECGSKVYSVWGLQSTSNRDKAHGFRGEDLCRRCLKHEQSPQTEDRDHVIG